MEGNSKNLDCDSVIVILIGHNVLLEGLLYCGCSNTLQFLLGQLTQ